MGNSFFAVVPFSYSALILLSIETWSYINLLRTSRVSFYFSTMHILAEAEIHCYYSLGSVMPFLQWLRLPQSSHQLGKERCYIFYKRLRRLHHRP